MKPKLDLGRDFASAPRRWFWPIRSIGQLMIVVALSGVVLAVLPSARLRRQSSPARARVRTIPNARIWGIQGPGGTLQSRAAERQPRDGFVFPAPAGIDDAMVVQARAGIDDAMVIDGSTRRPLSESAAPPAGNLRVPIPGQEPAPGNMPPNSWVPQPPAPTQPR